MEGRRGKRKKEPPKRNNKRRKGKGREQKPNKPTRPARKRPNPPDTTGTSQGHLWLAPSRTGTWTRGMKRRGGPRAQAGTRAKSGQAGPQSSTARGRMPSPSPLQKRKIRG